MSAHALVDAVAAVLARLPGVGRKSAERMALRLAFDKGGLLESLAAALDQMRLGVRCCSRCGALTGPENDPCRLCTDTTRDGKTVCVVEESTDVIAIEKSGGYRGRYHALMGRISPANRMGPGELRVRELVRRISAEGFEEVVLATDTDVEGEATAAYLKEVLTPLGVRITRLARGLPAGSGIMYADSVTLSRAMEGRIAY